MPIDKGPHWQQAIDASCVYDVAVVSPLEEATPLTQRMGVPVYFKREDLQPVFSFKIRGAYQKLASIPAAQRAKGVVAASAGNHAQGVAYGARSMGIPATIVMPKTAPDIKVNAVRRMGAKVELVGSTYDEAYQYANEWAMQHDLVFLHPFDDPQVMIGQGTVAKELVAQLPGLDMVFVPVGGGGLLGGMAAYLHTASPNTRLIGVEPDDAACMTAALQAGHLVDLDEVGIFVDGVAVKRAGAHPFQMASAHVHDMVTVTTDEVCAAIKDIFEVTRVACEPAGALALAGLKKMLPTVSGNVANAVAILSGANLNFDRLQHISERAALGEGREMMMLVQIPEQPGSFRAFCRQLGPHAITEFNYRYQHGERAVVLVGIEVPFASRVRLCDQLQAHGYEAIDLSHDEMAKVHLRHMMGGRVQLPDERLLHVEFPERPGALLRFLTKLGSDWSITLFHYRNHGADYGRVLLGLSVPPAEWSSVCQRLDEVGYPWHDHTHAVWKGMLFS